MSKTRGKTTIQYIGVQGEINSKVSSDYSFLYNVSSVIPDGKSIGDRVTLPDGRSFVLALAGTGGLQQEFGACYPYKTIVASSVVPAGYSTVAGVDYVTVTATSQGVAADGVFALDELRGGMIVIGNGAGQHPENRGIVGNDVSTGAGVMKIYLDAPLTQAVTASTTNIEVLGNQYRLVTSGNVTNSAYVTFVGVPVATALVSQYVWLQTRGKCWITSNNATCDSANDRTLYFIENGSVVSGADVTYAGKSYQMAGEAVDKSSSGSSNAPWVNLKIS
jgi:hypothetical protein